MELKRSLILVLLIDQEAGGVFAVLMGDIHPAARFLAAGVGERAKGFDDLGFSAGSYLEKNVEADHEGI